MLGEILEPFLVGGLHVGFTSGDFAVLVALHDGVVHEAHCVLGGTFDDAANGGNLTRADRIGQGIVLEQDFMNGHGPLLCSHSTQGQIFDLSFSLSSVTLSLDDI